MTTAEQFSSVADKVRAELDSVTRLAHVNTFHPNAFDWSEVRTQQELDFASEVVFGERGHDHAAIGYLTKELAQLAEIERHVSAVMTLVMGELHDAPDQVNIGHELHHALSCFAAEEIQHANTFYRYVRTLSGIEPRVPDALFDERLALFQANDHPYIKLVALCCSAYVGESVITVFEHRTDGLDPGRSRFLTRLLHTHGLDEARHVKIDHIAMKFIYPALTDEQRGRVRELVTEIEELNQTLAESFTVAVSAELDIDFVTGNPAAALQTRMTAEFAQRIFGEDSVLHTVDEILDAEMVQLIDSFSGSGRVHPPAVPVLSARIAP